MLSDTEKIAAFDKISELYYKHNFGSTTKTDFETLLFSEYLDHHIRNKLPYDDYSLARELGITQSRIRALKERKELKYPYAKDCWKESFAASVQNAKYDDQDHHVKFIIQDINVMNEVRHLIELKGWYDECSLNKKLLNLPLDCFVEICVDDQDVSSIFSEETKKTVKKISKADSAVNAFLSDFSKEGLKSFLMNASKTAISDVLSLLPFGGIAKIAFDFLVKVIESM